MGLSSKEAERFVRQQTTVKGRFGKEVENSCQLFREAKVQKFAMGYGTYPGYTSETHTCVFCTRTATYLDKDPVIYVSHRIWQARLSFVVPPLSVDYEFILVVTRRQANDTAVEPRRTFNSLHRHRVHPAREGAT